MYVDISVGYVPRQLLETTTTTQIPGLQWKSDIQAQLIGPAMTVTALSALQSANARTVVMKSA